MKGNLFTNNDFSTDIKTTIDNINTSINGLEPYLETMQQKVFIYIILILLLLALVILLMPVINI